MDNRSTFFCPLYPRHILPSFPVVTAGDLCLHSLCMLGRIISWNLHYRHGLFLRSKGTANEQRVKYRFATPDKFDANFPQSQIAAFHKILTSVPCLLFLLSPLGIARKNQLGRSRKASRKGK